MSSQPDYSGLKSIDLPGHYAVLFTGYGFLFGIATLLGNAISPSRLGMVLFSSASTICFALAVVAVVSLIAKRRNRRSQSLPEF